MVVPYQTQGKDGKKTPWKAVVKGKIVELCSAEETKETAAAKLATMFPDASKTPEKTKTGLLSFLKKSENKAPSASSTSEDSNDLLTQTSDEKPKPKPGEFRSGGLSELSSVRLAKFREQIAVAIASGNVSLDRALVSIFRDKVPVIPPEQYMLLSTGWELACEQFFVNGVPPWWIVVLLGNATVIAGMVEKSEPKKPPEDEQVGPDGNVHFKSPTRPTTNK